MLNDTTKKKINSLRQILVGKVPDPKSQVEQITNALIYKYMDDMDRQAEAFGGKAAFFVGEYEKYSWRKLMDPKVAGQERMNLYVEALEKMATNKNLSPIFRDILKGAFLPYRSPETLNLFLQEIDGFAYEHSEELGNAYEYLLSIMGAQGDAGQFRTPRHIIDFIVRVVDPEKGDKVHDPACGTAGFLISAYKHILGNHDGLDNETGEKTSAEKSLTASERKELHKNFVGYDISPEMVKLSRVNMFLHSFPEPKITEYDTLSDESRWEEKFDVILANPPFMSPKGGIMPHKRFGITATRAEVLFTDYIVEHLTRRGRAGIIVPEGIIFQSGKAYKELRKHLVEGGLSAVVSLPSGVFNPYAGVKTSILLFDAEMGRKKAEILFVKVTNDGYDLGAQRRPIDKNDLPEAERILRAWRKGEKIESSLSTWVSREQIAEMGDYNLSGDRYRMAKDYSNAKWPMVELGGVADLIRGVVYSKSDEVPEDGHQILRAMNISLDGELVLDDIKQISKKKQLKDSQKLMAGDLFVCLASGSKDHIGKVAYIDKKTEYYFGGFMGAIRVKDAVVLLPKYLFAILRSQAFNDYLRDEISGANINNLNASILGRYKIPLPPLEIQEQIVAELDGYASIIAGAKQITKNWKPKIDIDPEWERVKLGEVCTMASGGTPSKANPAFWAGNIPWVSSKDMKVDFLDDAEDHISELAIKESATKLVEADTLLGVVRSGILQHTFPVALTTRPMCHNQDIVSFNVDKLRLDIRYLLYTFKMENEKILQEGIKPGVTVQSFYSGFFKEYGIVLPPLETQKQIVEKIEAERALVESSKKLIEIYDQKTKDTIAKLWNTEL